MNRVSGKRSDTDRKGNTVMDEMPVLDVLTTTEDPTCHTCLWPLTPSDKEFSLTTCWKCLELEAMKHTDPLYYTDPYTH